MDLVLLESGTRDGSVSGARVMCHRRIPVIQADEALSYCGRPAWPHLEGSRGSVVNMASVNASLSFKILPSPAHTTNKAGIIGMDRQPAMEGREHGIRVEA
jgi:NAD(P)-dependent dehydrogenase (short-subunit alcohol dehydrogenase family)